MKKDITKRTEGCVAFQTYRPKKAQPKPQLPIDTMKYSPGECFQVELYELDKTDYITVVDKATGLIWSQKIANKETGTTIRALENIFLKVSMPFIIQTDNGKKFCLKKFDTFAEKNKIEVIRCSPYCHQGNGQAEESVNTLKTMIKRDRKSRVERLK